MPCRVKSARAKVNKKLETNPFLRSIFCCLAVWMAGRRRPLGAVRAKMLMIYNLAYLVVWKIRCKFARWIGVGACDCDSDFCHPFPYVYIYNNWQMIWRLRTSFIRQPECWLLCRFLLVVLVKQVACFQRSLEQQWHAKGGRFNENKKRLCAVL